MGGGGDGEYNYPNKEFCIKQGSFKDRVPNNHNKMCPAILIEA